MSKFSKFIRNKIEDTKFIHLDNFREDLTVDWIEYKKNKQRFASYKDCDYSIPKVIWIYWDSQTKNHLVDLCIQKTQHLCSDYQIHILNKNNIADYIKEDTNFNDSLSVAQKADYYRLKLLSMYGGIWLDASIFLTENLDWILQKVTYYDAFCFYSDDCTIDITQPITENWLIVAPKSSPFILAWFDEFAKCISSSQPTQYYAKQIKDKSFIQNIQEPDYLLCYLSAIEVLKSGGFNILYARSGSVGHYYNYKFLRNEKHLAYALLLKDKEQITTPKLIKFTKDTRVTAEKLLKHKKYNKNSLVGSAVRN